VHGALQLLTGLAIIATTFGLANAYSLRDEPRIRLYGGCAIVGIGVTAMSRMMVASSDPSAWAAVAAACFGVAFSAWHGLRLRSVSR
jgi:hypothetical protein